MSERFIIYAVVLCEEVRREHSGQAILIGAINHGPFLDKGNETTISRLAFYVEGRFQHSRDLSYRLVKSGQSDAIMEGEWLFRSNGQETEQHSELEEPIPANFTGVVNGQDIAFPDAGYYDFQLKYESDDWTTVRTYEFPALPNESFEGS